MDSTEKAGVNRQYKDRLFKFIFGNPENKDWTLSLYNAINGTSYNDPNEIYFTTIETALYMKMRNDVSVLVENRMNLWEQESSYNPNLPMRFFIYSGMVYSKFVEESDYNIYSHRQQKAPTPKCVCFYNGERGMADRTVLRLSDSFEHESDIEVKVTMLNINYGYNKELMEVCRPLNEYSWFTSRIRDVKKDNRDMTLEEAVDKVMEEVPEDFLIRPFLIANKAEVKRMCITEYNEEKTMKLTYEEGKEEGREEGRAEGREEGRAEGRAEGREEGRAEGREEGREEGEAKEKKLTVINMLKEGLSKELISKICRISVDDIALIAGSAEAF